LALKWQRIWQRFGSANSLGNPLSLGSVVNRVILPTLNRCEACGKAESDHQKAAIRTGATLASPSGTAGTQPGADWKATYTAWVCRIW